MSAGIEVTVNFSADDIMKIAELVLERYSCLACRSDDKGCTCEHDKHVMRGFMNDLMIELKWRKGLTGSEV